MGSTNRLTFLKRFGFHRIPWLFALWIFSGRVCDVLCDTADSDKVMDSSRNSSKPQFPEFEMNFENSPGGYSVEIQNFKVEPLPITSNTSSIVLTWKVETGVTPARKIKYKIEYKEDGGEKNSETCDSENHCKWGKYQINGLHPCTKYVIYLWAALDTETFPSSPSQGEVHTQISSAPKEFRMVSRSAESISLAWKSPEQTDGDFYDYILKYTDSVDREVAIKAKTTNVLNLVPFTYYAFSLSVRHIIGSRNCDGEAANLRTRTMAGAPSVTPVKVTVRSSTTVTVSWSKPLNPRGNLDGFTVTWKSQNGIVSGTRDESRDKLETEISSLEAYTDYSFSVYAFNRDDFQLIKGYEGRASAKTFTGSPEAVQEFKLEGKTTTSLTLQWKAPTKANGPLDGYCISIGDKNKICDLKKDANSYTFKNLTTYTSYTIKILAFNKDDSPNNLGKDLYGVEFKREELTKADKPSEPAAFSAEVTSYDKVSLTWSEPTTKNGPLSGYAISWQEEPGGQPQTVNAPGTAKSYGINGLKAYTTYQIKIFAYNKEGQEQLNGKEVTEKKRTFTSAPDAVENFDFQERTSTSLTIKWDVPTNVNGPLDGYCISGGSEIEKCDVQKDAKSYTLRNLTPYTPYTIKIQAFNNDDSPSNEGKRLRSGVSEKIATTKADKPSEPATFTANVFSHEVVNLAWSEPTTKNGPLSGYVISWQEEPGGQPQTVSATGSAKSYGIKDLKPYTTYQINIFAFNEEEKERLDGKEVTETRRTFTYKPGEVQNAHIECPAPRSVTVKWNLPETLNGPLDGFLLSINDTTPEVKLNRDTISYTFSNMTPYQDYSLNIKAFNLDDSKTPKENRLEGAVTEIPAKTPPDAPTNCRNVKAKEWTATGVSLTWEKPATDNGPLTGYLVEWKCEIGATCNKPGNKELSSSENTFNVPELQPYTNYSFSVKAFNEVENYNCNNGLKKKLYSDAVQFTHQTDVAEPGKVSSFEVTEQCSNSLSVKWSEPTVKHGPINGYVLSWSTEIERTDSVECPYSGISVNITGLRPYTNYTISLLAYNLYRASSPEEAKLNGTEALLQSVTDVAAPSNPDFQEVDINFDKTNSKISLAWRQPQELNGPIDGYYVKFRYSPRYPGDEAPEETTLEIGTEFQFPALHWREFVIQVFAFNDNLQGIRLNGSISSQQFETPIGSPIKPNNPQILNVQRHDLTISWDAPLPLTGPTKYELTIYEGTGSTNEGHCEKDLGIKWNPEPSLVLPVDKWDVTSMDIQGLKAFTCYRAMVTAVVHNYQNQTLNSTSEFSVPKQTLDGVPFPPDENLTSIAVHQKTLEFFIPAKLFDVSNGRIRRFGVIVTVIASKHENSTADNPRESGDILDESKLASWEDAQVNASIFKYRATPDQWNPRSSNSSWPTGKEDRTFNCTMKIQFGVDGEQCVLGAQDNCTGETYCNGPLKPGTTYKISFRKYTTGGFADSYALNFVTLSPKEPSSSGALIAVTATMSVLLIIAVIAFLAYRTGHLPRFWSLKKKEELSIELPVLAKSRPVKLSDFHADFLKQIADSAYNYCTEFEKLKMELSPSYPKDIGELPYNKPKNRFTNIIPYDHSRVPLTPTEEEGSDYINASFIPGIHHQKEYIATQGPLPDTVNDFWRLVWENNIQTIVMVTQCVEKGKAKCHEYWPSGRKSHHFGQMKIKLIQESVLPVYTIRQFSITQDETRMGVTQLHYTHWPDMGCPETPDELINFVRAVRDNNRSYNSSPVLVHCSAGVGRTGTFITLDRLMFEIENNRPEVDVLGTVLALRENRVNMVQTEDQYIYIHKCLDKVIEETLNSKTLSRNTHSVNEPIYGNIENGDV